MDWAEVRARERFWAKVRKTETCWLWTAATKMKGYGQFRYQGRTYIASRLAYIFTHGPLTREQFVLHKCDNTACVNPEHLYLGDNAQNMRDMAEKCRGSSVKLRPEDVIMIRKSFQPGVPGGTMALARQFNVNESAIRQILKRLTWNHL